MVAMIDIEVLDERGVLHGWVKVSRGTDTRRPSYQLALPPYDLTTVTPSPKFPIMAEVIDLAWQQWRNLKGEQWYVFCATTEQLKRLAKSPDFTTVRQLKREHENLLSVLSMAKELVKDLFRGREGLFPNSLRHLADLLIKHRFASYAELVRPDR